MEQTEKEKEAQSEESLRKKRERDLKEFNKLVSLLGKERLRKLEGERDGGAGGERGGAGVVGGSLCVSEKIERTIVTAAAAASISSPSPTPYCLTPKNEPGSVERDQELQDKEKQKRTQNGNTSLSEGVGENSHSSSLSPSSSHTPSPGSFRDIIPAAVENLAAV